jgi:hypothetical protein
MTEEFKKLSTVCQELHNRCGNDKHKCDPILISLLDNDLFKYEFDEFIKPGGIPNTKYKIAAVLFEQSMIKFALWQTIDNKLQLLGFFEIYINYYVNKPIYSYSIKYNFLEYGIEIQKQGQDLKSNAQTKENRIFNDLNLYLKLVSL